MKRFHFLFAILFSAIFLSISEAQSHNITWGTRNVRDTLLKREIVFKESSFLRKATGDFEFNIKNTPYIHAITQVVVTDQYKNGKGGYATLTAGGPLHTFVKIHFTSQRSHGYNFIVDIYGQ